MELIVGEVLTSTTYGTTYPVANALQFCQEEGYASVGGTVGDVSCEHTGGGDNDDKVEEFQEKTRSTEFCLNSLEF